MSTYLPIVSFYPFVILFTVVGLYMIYRKIKQDRKAQQMKNEDRPSYWILVLILAGLGLLILIKQFQVSI